MTRWIDSRKDSKAAIKNLEKATNAELNKRACPFCGGKYGQLPRHMRHCDERD